MTTKSKKGSSKSALLTANPNPNNSTGLSKPAGASANPNTNPADAPTNPDDHNANYAAAASSCNSTNINPGADNNIPNPNPSAAASLNLNPTIPDANVNARIANANGSANPNPNHNLKPYTTAATPNYTSNLVNANSSRCIIINPTFDPNRIINPNPDLNITHYNSMHHSNDDVMIDAASNPSSLMMMMMSNATNTIKHSPSIWPASNHQISSTNINDSNGPIADNNYNATVSSKACTNSADIDGNHHHHIDHDHDDDDHHHYKNIPNTSCEEDSDGHDDDGDSGSNIGSRTAKYNNNSADYYINISNNTSHNNNNISNNISSININIYPPQDDDDDDDGVDGGNDDDDDDDDDEVEDDHNQDIAIKDRNGRCTDNHGMIITSTSANAINHCHSSAPNGVISDPDHPNHGQSSQLYPFPIMDHCLINSNSASNDSSCCNGSKYMDATDHHHHPADQDHEIHHHHHQHQHHQHQHTNYTSLMVNPSSISANDPINLPPDPNHDHHHHELMNSSSHPGALNLIHAYNQANHQLLLMNGSLNLNAIDQFGNNHIAAGAEIDGSDHHHHHHHHQNHHPIYSYSSNIDHNEDQGDQSIMHHGQYSASPHGFNIFNTHFSASSSNPPSNHPLLLSDPPHYMMNPMNHTMIMSYDNGSNIDGNAPVSNINMNVHPALASYTPSSNSSSPLINYSSSNNHNNNNNNNNNTSANNIPFIFDPSGNNIISNLPLVEDPDQSTAAANHGDQSHVDPRINHTSAVHADSNMINGSGNISLYYNHHNDSINSYSMHDPHDHERMDNHDQPYSFGALISSKPLSLSNGSGNHPQAGGIVNQNHKRTHSDAEDQADQFNIVELSGQRSGPCAKKSNNSATSMSYNQTPDHQHQHQQHHLSSSSYSYSSIIADHHPDQADHQYHQSANNNYINTSCSTGSTAVINHDQQIAQKKTTPAGAAISASKSSKSSHSSKPARTKQSIASDPQSIAARLRRERISERLKILQELVPNGTKVDLVTMLEKAINYVKFLQLQVKVLTTDEYWPNCQKLNHPNDINILNLIMQSSAAKDQNPTCKKNESKCESDS